ncbi:MAG: DUF402 domain-containing protein [Coprobacillus sp.]|nr:DUF402 domain-containing protein [Coprobacillus sp.]
MAIESQSVKIICYKHDGSLHRTWEKGFVLEDNDEFIITAAKRNHVSEPGGREWYTNEPTITIFSKKDWYNVLCMFKKSGISYYCNISSPSIIEDNAIKYIDYDLDIKKFTDGKIKILDQTEYRNNKKLYEYSDDLDKVLHYAMEKMKKLMEDEMFPFDDEISRRYYEVFQSYLNL